MTAVRGSCLCGEVAFEVERPFDAFLNCHCSRCRKASGTAHSCEVVVKAAALRWLRGETSVVRFDLPTARSFATAFCKNCGCPMPHLTRKDQTTLQNVCLDALREIAFAGKAQMPATPTATTETIDE